MEASIREFGFKIPMLVRSNGEVVDGHLRLKAAKNLGLQELPVILRDEWTPAQMKAFRLLVNTSVEWADWDVEALHLELGELKETDFDLSLTGFDFRETDGILDGSWAPPEREAQKPPAPPPEPDPANPNQPTPEDPPDREARGACRARDRQQQQDRRYRRRPVRRTRQHVNRYLNPPRSVGLGTINAPLPWRLQSRCLSPPSPSPPTPRPRTRNPAC